MIETLNRISKNVVTQLLIICQSVGEGVLKDIIFNAFYCHIAFRQFYRKSHLCINDLQNVFTKHAGS